MEFLRVGEMMYERLTSTLTFAVSQKMRIIKKLAEDSRVAQVMSVSFTPV
jgi:hypothetical protein